MVDKRERMVASQAARAAGKLLRDNFRKELQVSYKSDIELVTELDHQAESLIATILHKSFPDYGLLAEEDHAGRRSRKKKLWVVDPLDGTTNYARGLPLFAVSIALIEQGQVTLGVVYNPIPDEMFLAEKGEGAWMNWRQVYVSKTAELSKALLASGFPYDAWTTERDNLEEWKLITKHALTPRCSGCASLDLCYVAAGMYDGYWELDLQPWDMAAGALIVMEAGGTVTDVSGKPFYPFGHQILAANPAIHGLLLEVLKQAGGKR